MVPAVVVRNFMSLGGLQRRYSSERGGGAETPVAWCFSLRCVCVWEAPMEAISSRFCALPCIWHA